MRDWLQRKWIEFLTVLAFIYILTHVFFATLIGIKDTILLVGERLKEKQCET